MKTDNLLNKTKDKNEEEVSHIASESLKIDEKGMQHVMNLLANIYQNSALAVFREYLANGSDAMREAKTLGVTPMLVTLKSPEEEMFYRYYDSKAIPGKGVFSIRDFGTGMNKEALLKVYSRYGASTKTTDNDSIGGFGIGAKSALAITDYFEISSFVDGIRLDGYIKTEKDKTATLYITKESKTKEQNGLEVRVPIDKGTHERILAESQKFFYAWGKNTVLVNGETPKHLGQFEQIENYIPLNDSTGNTIGWYQINTRKILETQVMSNNRWASSDKLQTDTPNIFIGNIPYSIPNEVKSFADLKHAFKKLDRSGIILKINAPIGSLTLSPDRESIQDNDENVRVLLMLLIKAARLVPVTLNSYIQTLDFKEAYKLYAHNAYSFFTDDPEPELSKKAPDVYHYSNNRVTQNIFTQLNLEVQHRGKVLPTDFNFKSHYTEGDINYTLHTVGSAPVKTTINENTSINLLRWAVSTFELGEIRYQPTLMMRRDCYNYNNKKFMGTLFLYGEYKGRSNNPVMRYGKPVIRALTGIDKYNHYQIIHVESELAPPAEVSAVTTVMEINEFERYAKSLRKAPVPTNRAETLYPVITYDPILNIHHIQNIPKITLSNINNLIILDETVFSKLLKKDWDWKTELSNKSARRVKDSVYDTGLPVLEYYKGYNFTIVPKTRNVSALLKIVPEAKTLSELWKEEYSQWAKADKNKLFLYKVLYDNRTISSVLKKYSENDLELNIKNKLLKNFLEDMKFSKNKVANIVKTFGVIANYSYGGNHPLGMFYPSTLETLKNKKAITNKEQEDFFERLSLIEQAVPGITSGYIRGKRYPETEILKMNIEILDILFEGFPELRN